MPWDEPTLLNYAIITGFFVVFAITHQVLEWLDYRRLKRRWAKQLRSSSFFAKKETKKLYTEGGISCHKPQSKQQPRTGRRS